MQTDSAPVYGANRDPYRRHSYNSEPSFSRSSPFRHQIPTHDPRNKRRYGGHGPPTRSHHGHGEPSTNGMINPTRAGLVDQNRPDSTEIVVTHAMIKRQLSKAETALDDVKQTETRTMHKFPMHAALNNQLAAERKKLESKIANLRKEFDGSVELQAKVQREDSRAVNGSVAPPQDRPNQLVADLQKKIDLLETKNTQAAERYDREQEALQERYNKLEKAVQAVQAVVQSGQNVKPLEALREKLEKMHGETALQLQSVISGDIIDLKNAVDKGKEEVARLSDGIVSREEIAHIEQQITGLLKSVTDLNSTKASITSGLEIVRAGHRDMRETIENRAAIHTDQVERRLGALEADTKATRDTQQQLSDSIKSITSTMASAKNGMTQEQARQIARIEQATTALNNHAVLKEFPTLQENVMRLQREYERYSQAVIRNDHSIRHIDARLTSINTEDLYRAIVARIDGNVPRISQPQNIVRSLMAQIENFRQSISSKAEKAALSQLEDELARVREQLGPNVHERLSNVELKKQLQALTAQVSDLQARGKEPLANSNEASLIDEVKRLADSCDVNKNDIVTLQGTVTDVDGRVLELEKLEQKAMVASTFQELVERTQKLEQDNSHFKNEQQALSNGLQASRQFQERSEPSIAAIEDKLSGVLQNTERHDAEILAIQKTATKHDEVVSQHTEQLERLHASLDAASQARSHIGEKVSNVAKSVDKMREWQHHAEPQLQKLLDGYEPRKTIPVTDHDFTREEHADGHILLMSNVASTVMREKILAQWLLLKTTSATRMRYLEEEKKQVLVQVTSLDEVEKLLSMNAQERKFKGRPIDIAVADERWYDGTSGLGTNTTVRGTELKLQKVEGSELSGGAADQSPNRRAVLATIAVSTRNADAPITIDESDDYLTGWDAKKVARTDRTTASLNMGIPVSTRGAATTVGQGGSKKPLGQSGKPVSSTAKTNKRRRHGSDGASSDATPKRRQK